MLMDKYSQCAESIKQAIASVLNISQEELGSNPAVKRTPGWDSLATIEIVTKLEEKFETNLPDEIITESIDFRMLCDFLCEKEQ